MTYTEIYTAMFSDDVQFEYTSLSTSQQIAWDILRDLTDRRGLANEFYNCDADIQDEIFDTWVDIIDKHLNNK
jgi:hypothetical protein